MWVPMHKKCLIGQGAKQANKAKFALKPLITLVNNVKEAE